MSDIEVLDVDAGSALVSAVRHGLPVVTQDDGFSAIEGMGGLTVIRV